MLKLSAPLLVLLVPLSSAYAGPRPFTAGHYYTPIDGGQIVEWNSNLQEVRRFTVPGVDTVTGAVFGADNMLVFIGRRQGTERVMQIDASGAVLREYDTGLFSVSRGSYIDFDPGSHRYVFALHTDLMLLDQNLAPLALTNGGFVRASGVAFGGDGRIFATDQFQNGVRTYTQGPPPVPGPTTPYIASVATGMDVAADGRLLLTQFNVGRVDWLDPASGIVTPLLTGLGSGGATDAKVLPDGNIMVVRWPTQLRIYSPAGVLLGSSVPAGALGDSVAFFVPAPGSLSMLLVAAALGRRRRTRP